jgi:hypothetical protein
VIEQREQVSSPDEEQRAEATGFLRESREDIEAGRTEPATEALEHLAEKHKLNSKGK